MVVGGWGGGAEAEGEAVRAPSAETPTLGKELEREGSGGGGGSGRDAHGPRSLAEQGGTRDVPWGCGEPGERSSCDRRMEDA